MNKNSVNYDKKLNANKSKKDRLKSKKNRGLKKNYFRLKRMNYVELRMKCGLKLRDNNLRKSNSLIKDSKKKCLIKRKVRY